MKTILESIQTRLSGIIEFNYIGEDWGQLNTDPAVAMTWPCCLFNISRAFYNDLGRDQTKTPKNRQTGMFRLKLNIANPRLDTTTENWKEHDLMEKVHTLLHGYSPAENCSVMKRKNYKRLKRTNGMIVYKVIYTFEITNV